MCELFLSITFCKKHKDTFEDMRWQMERVRERKRECVYGDAQMILDIVNNQYLICIESIVISMLSKTLPQFGFPPPSRESRAVVAQP